MGEGKEHGVRGTQPGRLSGAAPGVLCRTFPAAPPQFSSAPPPRSWASASAHLHSQLRGLHEQIGVLPRRHIDASEIYFIGKEASARLARAGSIFRCCLNQET